MDDENDRPEFSREATMSDLVALCRHLNEVGANYVVQDKMFLEYLLAQQRQEEPQLKGERQSLLGWVFKTIRSLFYPSVK